MLTKVQAAILEPEAALERQAAEVQSHELELQDYDLVGGGAGTPDPEKRYPHMLNSRENTTGNVNSTSGQRSSTSTLSERSRSCSRYVSRRTDVLRF
jgi:hypothetical protein